MPGKDKSASDLVREIRQETARRKRVWRKMEAAAREAVKAVTKEAQRHGVKGMDWFGWLNADSFESRGPEKQTEIRYSNSKNPNPRFRGNRIIVFRSGAIVEPYLGHGEYEGYPDLTNRDPIIFKKAAVEHLMGELTDCLREKKARKKKRK